MTENQGGGDGGEGVQSDGDGGGGGAPDFHSSLPEGIRSHGSLRNFKNVGELGESYIQAREAISSKSMANMDAPTDDAGRRAVLEKLGRAPPVEAGEYKLPDTQAGKQFRAWAHLQGLTTKQAEGMYAAMQENGSATLAERKKQAETRKANNEAAIRQKWGDKYDPNMELARKGRDGFLSKELQDALEATGLSDHPELLDHFSQVGRSLQEGSLKPGSAAGSGAPANNVEGASKSLFEFEAKNRDLLNSQNDSNPEVVAAKKARGTLLANFARLKSDAAGAGGGV